MTIEDVFNGAKAVYHFYFGLLKAVVQEIGEERAMALSTKMLETMSAMQGKKLKEEAGIEEIDAKTAASLAWTVPESLGITEEVIEESPQRVVLKVGRCPIYEAAQAMGVDPETACRAGPLRYMDVLVKQLNPNLSYRVLKYRSAPDDFCEEEIVIA